jgi:hypothetical protein
MIADNNTDYQVNQPLYLKFTSPCHPFPFLERDMEVSVMLCDDTGRVIYGKDVSFRIVLQYEDDMETIVEDALNIKNMNRQMIHGTTGRSPIITLSCKIPTTNNRPFVLTALPQQNSSLSNPIIPSSSSSFQVVTHRVEICNENTIPTVWFRDEGGKGNQVVVTVNVTDSNGQFVSSRAGMRLRCILLYEDGSVVPDQSILEISNDTTMYLKSDGTATIKFRITEVSQRHDSRRFKVMVAPDTQYNQINGDVSHHCTPSIEVRSKVSKENKLKRQRREEEAKKASENEESNKKKKSHNDNVGNMSPANSSIQLFDEGVSSSQYQAMKRFSETAVDRLLDIHHQITNNPSLSLADVASSIEGILDFHQRLGLTPPVGTHSSSDLSFDDLNLFTRQISDGEGRAWASGFDSLLPDAIRQSSLFAYEIKDGSMLNSERNKEYRY